jgi:uncharacterized protein (TIGR00369 family)
MRKIINPFKGLDGYNCFGCSPGNEFGLRMEFFEDGEEVASIWDPEDYYQGYGNLLHGGVQAALLDEIASWYIFARMNTAGVTSGIEIKYIKPVFMDRGPFEIRSRLKEIRDNIIIISAELKDNSGQICSGAAVTYFTYPDKIARRKLRYPGMDAFFENK